MIFVLVDSFFFRINYVIFAQWIIHYLRSKCLNRFINNRRMDCCWLVIDWGINWLWIFDNYFIDRFTDSRIYWLLIDYSRWCSKCERMVSRTTPVSPRSWTSWRKMISLRICLHWMTLLQVLIIKIKLISIISIIFKIQWWWWTKPL